MRFIKFLIITYLLTIISCSPSLGASWYAKTGGKNSGISMYVTSIKVLNHDVTVNDPDYRAIEGDKVRSFAKAKRFSITVPHTVSSIDADSIKIEAYEDYKKQKPLKISLEIEGDLVPLVQGEAVSVILRVKDNAGKYDVEQKFISVTREVSDNSEVPSEPEPEDPNEVDPPSLENPIDENGNKKFKVKINTKEEKVDPFDYYGKDFIFPASRFDGWILNMTSMTSENVASYAFKEGQWQGSPLSCIGEDVGQGQMNHTWNLKYYKYKNQEERWKEHGGYVPSIDEKEKKRRERFIFFRFTGSASMGIQLDNSMFCVDTHTKFLFYYSDPSNISGVGVPSNWKDYEEASKDYHKYFEKPFYLTDPVGYVKENGECVIYSWCKEHIKANNYTATLNPSYVRQASRKLGGKGYSPYRDEKIKKTKERIVEENPEYTVEKPVITGQSGSLYLSIDSPEKAIMSVTVKKAPENEELSYQWYKNATNSKEGGELINGAITAEYTMPKEVIDVYCYCVVTNKNTKNGKEARSISQPIKVRIAQSNADLKIDAEIPIIIKHPKSSKHSFVEGRNVSISLNVEVSKPKDKGVLTYQWFESENETTENGTKIENAKDKVYNAELSGSGVKYYYCCVTNTNDKATGEKATSVFSAVAKIEIEQLYELTFGCVGEGSLTVFGGEDGTKTVRNSSEDKIKVKLGTDLVFIAKPNKGWEIEKWEGKATISEGDINTAQMKIEKAEDVEGNVVVNFKKIPKKGVIGISEVMIQNLSLGGLCTTWTVQGAKVDYAYFDFDVSTYFKDDNNEEFKQLFSSKGNGKDLYTYEKDRIKSMVYSDSKDAKDEKISFFNRKPSLKLSLKLVKTDRGAFWKVTNEQIISQKGDNENINGDIEFEYDELKDCWHLKSKKADYNIDKVSIVFDEGFTLKRGQEKPFAVTYEVNNPANHAKGNVKVVYTLLWE
ncbi:MAG: hypothetical protein ACTTJ3_04100 [Treponema sp.]